MAEWFEMDLEQMRWAPTWNAALQNPYAANQLRAWPASNRIGDIHNNDSSLLDLVDALDEPIQGLLL